jgi:hypothetical protein
MHTALVDRCGLRLKCGTAYNKCCMHGTSSAGADECFSANLLLVWSFKWWLRRQSLPPLRREEEEEEVEEDFIWKLKREIGT